MRTAAGRTRVILNPSAAGGRALRNVSSVRAVLEQKWQDIDWCESRSARHLADLCAEAVSEGFARVIIGGGDGSVHHALQALAQSETALGILPLGTGNDFAAAAGLPANAIDAARALCDGDPRAVDLGAANGVYFCCVAGLGMDTPALKYINDSWLPRGPFLYQLAAVKTLVGFPPCELSVITGESEFHGRFHFAAFTNTPTYAGGNPVSPAATIADGKLDYCLFAAVPLLRRFGTFLRMKRGKHIGQPAVFHGVAENMTVNSPIPVPVTLDGELTSITTPLDIQLRRGVLKLICPGSNLPTRMTV